MKITKRNKRIGPTFIFMLVTLTVIVPGVLFCASGKAMEKSASGSKCLECHSRPGTMPGIYNQYIKSMHFKVRKTCIDCHGAQEGDPDAFLHHNEWISIIVTPKDCKRCHEKEVEEFTASAHHDAHTLVTEGCGRIFSDNLLNTQYPLPKGGTFDKTAAGVTACWRCHGSKIKMDPGKKGRPTPGTWPNSGMARVNPDGSTGNCAACHESHEFSVAQARKPESCAVCHNSGGGDPQYEAYLQSRHGMTYAAMEAQMNLDSPDWIAGKDYCAAPTCATCHMSAAPGLTATHNINSRLDWSSFLQGMDSLAVREKCGEAFHTDYKQPKPDSKHWENMKKVCLACHSGTFAENYKKQYEHEVSLFKTKWLKPGKALFNKAVEVIIKMNEKKPYAIYTHPVDFAWWNICNGNAKSAKTGASMMSPGSVETGAGGVVSNWYTSFLPAVEAVIQEAKNIDPRSDELNKALRILEEAYKNIASDPVYFGPWKK